MENLLQLNNKIMHAANIFFAIKKKRIYEENKNMDLPWIDFLNTCEFKTRKTQIDLGLNIYIDQVGYYQASGKQVLQTQLS